MAKSLFQLTNSNSEWKLAHAKWMQLYKSIIKKSDIIIIRALIDTGVKWFIFTCFIIISRHKHYIRAYCYLSRITFECTMHSSNKKKKTQTFQSWMNSNFFINVIIVPSTWEREREIVTTQFLVLLRILLPPVYILERGYILFMSTPICIYILSLSLSLFLCSFLSMWKISVCFIRTILKFFRRRRCMYMSGFFSFSLPLTPTLYFFMLAFVSIVWPYCASTVWC